MATYYKRIKGKNYDKKLIDAAERSVKGKGDGRISLQDAKKLLGSVKDATGYSDIEKNTMKYIRDNYDFTPEADRWFRTEIRKWAATKASAVKTVRRKKVGFQKPSIPEPERNIFERDQIPLPQEPEKKAGTRGKNIFLRILLFLIIIIVLAFIVFFFSPTCRDQIKNRIAPFLSSPKYEIKIPEAKKPVSEPAKKQAEALEEKSTHEQYYTVQVKDDLVSISEKVFHDYSKWKDIYEANRDIIKNPTMIFPGQKLKIPQTKK